MRTSSNLALVLASTSSLSSQWGRQQRDVRDFWGDFWSDFWGDFWGWFLVWSLRRYWGNFSGNFLDTFQISSSSARFRIEVASILFCVDSQNLMLMLCYYQVIQSDCFLITLQQWWGPLNLGSSSIFHLLLVKSVRQTATWCQRCYISLSFSSSSGSRE